MVGEAEQRERFAYALQSAMAMRKVSARQLAAKLGVDPRRVAGWLKGRGLPTLYEGPLLATTLRVDEDLFRNPPAVPLPPPYPIERYLLEAVESGVGEGLRRARARSQPAPDKPSRSPGRSPRAVGEG